MNPEIDPVVPCAAAIPTAQTSAASTIPKLATTEDTGDAEEKTFLRVLCVPRGEEFAFRRHVRMRTRLIAENLPQKVRQLTSSHKVRAAAGEVKTKKTLQFKV